jgi:hypothetical protein
MDIELTILEEARRLLMYYADKDLAHNAQGIFALAVDAAKILTLSYNHPLAFHLAQSLVNYNIALYNAAHGLPTSLPVYDEAPAGLVQLQPTL